MTSYDKYGVKKFYKTKPNCNNYYCDWDDERDVVNDTDPIQSKLMVSSGTDTGNGLHIGGGIASFTTHDTSPRLFIVGPWLNTEQTAYVRLNGDAGTNQTTSIQLSSRSNHHGAENLPYPDDMGSIVSPGADEDVCSGCISPGFGGYILRYGSSTTFSHEDIELEYIHGLYRRDIVQTTWTPEYNKWIGFKLVTRNIDNIHLRLTGYINTQVSSQSNWKKTLEYTFPGTDGNLEQDVYDGHPTYVSWGATHGDKITAGTITDIRNRQVFNKKGYWNWLRFEDANNIDIKYFSVREISPNSPY
jgi:hypothetical protein